MPDYVYLDHNAHRRTITHRMLYTTGIICAACGSIMWRKPQSPSVNWGGLRPSQGALSPEIQKHLDTADEQRARFDEEHEKHEYNN